MAIPENRMSTTPVIADYLATDGRSRVFQTIDYEDGPIGLNDVSGGMKYQPWTLSWESLTGNFIATPENTGSPSVVLNAANVVQCSFCFDQNAHINLAYQLNTGEAYLYWYDTLAANWATDLLAAGTNFPMLSLDDKRRTQSQNNDMLLWYTRQQPDTTWNLYKREQRERFQIEQLMATDVWPYCVRAGMHKELRGMVALQDLLPV